MKPRFTTSEPYPLWGGVDPDDPIETLEPIKYDSPDRYWNKDLRYSVYIHGEAECDMGFDIPLLVDGRMPEEEGKYECIVNGKDGELYLWVSKGEFTDFVTNEPITMLKGFIVYQSDIKARVYAEECLKGKPCCI